ncbi:hypothetical protein BG000_000352 [Podila horticola]|nr:hypothetical protein BG000_000352 [Podila horticola]
MIPAKAYTAAVNKVELETESDSELCTVHHNLMQTLLQGKIFITSFTQLDPASGKNVSYNVIKSVEFNNGEKEVREQEYIQAFKDK